MNNRKILKQKRAIETKRERERDRGSELKASEKL